MFNIASLTIDSLATSREIPIAVLTDEANALFPIQGKICEVYYTHVFPCINKIPYIFDYALILSK